MDTNEELWNRPQAVMKSDVDLTKAIKICRKSGDMPNISQADLEGIMRGKVVAWKIYAVKPIGEGRLLLSLIGRTFGWRWFQRGDFGMGTSYYRAEVEIKVADAKAMTWQFIEPELTAEKCQSDQKTSKHGGFFPRIKAATA